MEIEIRDACIEDVPVVAWTVLTALDMSTDDMDRFVKSCSDEDTMYSWKNSIIATVDNVPVGCLIAYDGSRYDELRKKTWSSLWEDTDSSIIENTGKEAHEGEFYLDSMAILPEYRKLGIGKLLIGYAIKKGKDLGCLYSSLLVDVNKPRLKAYYETIGFKEFGKMEFFGHEYYRMKYI